MILAEWMERAAIACLREAASSASLDMQVPITDRPCCYILRILEPPEDRDDEPCRALLGDATHHFTAILGDAPVARLLRRYSSKPLKSFAGCTVEVVKGSVRVAVKGDNSDKDGNSKEDKVVMVLMVDDFQVLGGLVAGCAGVEGRVPVASSAAVLQCVERLVDITACASAAVAEQPVSTSASADSTREEAIIEAACEEPEDLEKALFLDDDDEDNMDITGYMVNEENILDLCTDDDSADSLASIEQTQPNLPESLPADDRVLYDGEMQTESQANNQQVEHGRTLVEMTDLRLELDTLERSLQISDTLRQDEYQQVIERYQDFASRLENYFEFCNYADPEIWSRISELQSRIAHLEPVVEGIECIESLRLENITVCITDTDNLVDSVEHVEPVQPDNMMEVVEATQPMQSSPTKPAIQEQQQAVEANVIVREKSDNYIHEQENTLPAGNTLPSGNTPADNQSDNNPTATCTKEEPASVFVKPLPRKRTASAIDYSKWTF